MSPAPAQERWIWTELLAFDNTQDDLGVGVYYDTVGFVPDGFSILISSPDFVLQHKGLEQDAHFPADICAREGHNGNEERARQDWTRFQLRRLVGLLQQRGSRVFFSNFTDYLRNRFHHEWLSDHPECMAVWADSGPVDSVFVLARFKDGTYLRDFFARQLARVCEDYGFDGWHGPDGFGPLHGITKLGYDDDMIGQFIESGWAGKLPEVVTAPSGNLPERLTPRAEWIRMHRREEWALFFSDLWAAFWGAVCRELHAIGRQAYINSPWTRDPFEALYRYGIEYRKIAAAGVDAIVMETCGGSILLQSEERNFHYDYLAMLMLTKAHVPDTKLLFLNTTKDVVENWNLIQHCPPMLEREIYSISNVFHILPDGSPQRAVTGPLVCLGDAITREEWAWMEQRWAVAHPQELPRRIPGLTLVWSDAALRRAIASYPAQRDPSIHWIAMNLLEECAPIQSTVEIAHVEAATGPLLVINPHHLSADERRLLLNSGKPLVVIGPDFEGWPTVAGELSDSATERPMRCRFYQCPPVEGLSPVSSAPMAASEDLSSIDDPWRFRDELHFRPVSNAFYTTLAAKLREVTGVFAIEDYGSAVGSNNGPGRPGVMVQEKVDGTLQVAVKSSSFRYARFRLSLHCPIESIKVRSPFPVTRVPIDGEQFTLIVPPRGIVIADVVPANR